MLYSKHISLVYLLMMYTQSLVVSLLSSMGRAWCFLMSLYLLVMYSQSWVLCSVSLEIRPDTGQAFYYRFYLGVMLIGLDVGSQIHVF